MRDFKNALEQAISKGDAEAVRNLVRSPDAAAQRGVLSERLLSAYYTDTPARLDILRLLLENGADPNSRTSEGQPFVHFMASRRNSPGELQAIELMFAHGMDARAMQGDKSALMLAAMAHDPAMLKLLLDRGVEVSLKSREETALAHAIYGEASSLRERREAQREVVQMLLAHGADADTVDSRGKSVLQYAADIGDADLARQLIDKGAGVDRAWRMTNDTPLMKAAEKGDIALVRLLLERGADPSKKNILGTTALDRAASGGHTEVALLLMRSGKAPEPGPKALHAAARGETRSMLETLLQHGADVHALDSYGWSALMHACSAGRAASAQRLLEAGARVEVADPKTGVTPLMLACERNSPELVQLLLERKAAVNASDADGRSVLVRSVANALGGTTSLDVIRLLLDAGADSETRDTDSLTPLMMAAVAGNMGLLALLILKKAAIGATDACGVPAIEQAEIYGHREAVDLLLRFGGKHVQLSYPICKLQNCPICAGLPNRVSVDNVRDEELPPAHKRLRWTDRASPVCPYCHTRYSFSNEYEFGIPSIDIDTLERQK
ncbi:MAG TPA: ankyrin repeat domain-containing protein [Burkholderiales bacterium]|nr:ankyrin repeat domain-containing protein [Burkholderiales bacterium]